MSEAETSLPGIPKSVRDQGAEADRLLKGLNTPEGSDQEEGADKEPTKPQHPEEGNEPPEGAEKKGRSEPESEPESGSEGEEDTWKARYQTLKGKYDAEVPRLSQRNRELEQEVQRLNTKVQALESQTQGAGTEGSDETREEQVLNPDDFADYGEEFQALVKKLNSLESENRNLKEQLGTVNQTVGSVREHQQTEAEQKFWSDINSAVPQWERIHEDPAFQEWLRESDPFAGRTRDEALREAASNLESQRAIAILNAFVEGTEAGAKHKNPGSDQDSGQSRSKKKPEPRNVQPSKSRAETPPDSSEGKKTWTPQDIKDFYDKVRAGKFKGREEEKNKIENDIFQAQKEGRITA